MTRCAWVEKTCKELQDWFPAKIRLGLFVSRTLTLIVNGINNAAINTMILAWARDEKTTSGLWRKKREISFWQCHDLPLNIKPLIGNVVIKPVQCAT